MKSAGTTYGYRRFHFSPLFLLKWFKSIRPKVSASCLCIVPITVPKPSKANGTDAHTPAENPFEFVILVVVGFGKLAGCWDSKSGGVHPRESFYFGSLFSVTTEFVITNPLQFSVLERVSAGTFGYIVGRHAVTIRWQTGTILSQPQIFFCFFSALQKPIRLGINCAPTSIIKIRASFQVQKNRDR